MLDGEDGRNGECDECEGFGKGGTYGSVEGDSLFFANSAVLEASIAEHICVCARVASQAGLASLVQEVEDDQSSDPHDDAKAPGHDAVDVSRAKRTTKGALEREREDSDGCKEIGGSNGK